MSTIITRIAPSPTGRFHIGTARTALFNYLYAKHMGGLFMVRIEDTDKERSKIEYETELLEGFAWLGLESDEIVWQSKRVSRHHALLEQLVSEGKAYISHEESKAHPGEMVDVIRLKNEGQVVQFNDEIRGEISVDTTDLGDFVIARSINEPLYHFAVVVDDWDMHITHVIRGDDHISNTPRQILIQEAIGAPRPIYAHLPLIVDEHRAKLSKRKGSTSVFDYRAEGFLPEALVNYLAFLGWNPGPAESREYLSLSELSKIFSLGGLQKSAAAWNREKLLSVNQHWLREMSDADFATALGEHNYDAQMVQKIIPLLKERAQTLGEARTMFQEDLAFFFTDPKVDRTLLLLKDKSSGTFTKIVLEEFTSAITLLSDTNADAVKESLMAIANEREVKEKGSRGAALWALRYALSGKERSPDPFTVISILGKEESRNRIQKAIKEIS